MSTALLNTYKGDIEAAQWGIKGWPGGASGDGLVAGEGAESGTWGRRGRGGGMQWSAVTWCSATPAGPAGAGTQVVPRRRPYRRCSTGRRLRHCRRLHWASARHITSTPRERGEGAVVGRCWPKTLFEGVQCCRILKAGEGLPGGLRIPCPFHQDLSARAAPEFPCAGS